MQLVNFSHGGRRNMENEFLNPKKSGLQVLTKREAGDSATGKRR